MGDSRRSYKRAEEVALLAEVESRCPLCGKRLFRKSEGREYKRYELAHIYPLNPTIFQVAELEGVERLSDDVNDPANIIPLCRGCHGDFDDPRSRNGYEKLSGIKRRISRRIRSRELALSFPLAIDFSTLIGKLSDLDAEGDLAPLNWEPKKVKMKLGNLVSVTLRRKVRNNVRDYFGSFRTHMRELERESPSASELICAQVRAYYLAQATQGLGPEEVLENVVAWIMQHAEGTTLEEAEAAAAYFVQNCEVFD